MFDIPLRIRRASPRHACDLLQPLRRAVVDPARVRRGRARGGGPRRALRAQDLLLQRVRLQSGGVPMLDPTAVAGQAAGAALCRHCVPTFVL